MDGWTDGRMDGRMGGRSFPAQCQPLTRVLPELVHGLEVDDVGRQLDVDLAQHYAATGVLLQHVLDVVADGSRVGPPAPVLVQPLPHHHTGQVLGGKTQATGGQHGPRTLSRHAGGTAVQSRTVPRHRDAGLTRSPSESSSRLPPAAVSGAQQSKRCGALQRRALPARSPRSPSRPVPLPRDHRAGLGPSITRHVFLGPSSSPWCWQCSGSKKPPGPPRLLGLRWLKGGWWPQMMLGTRNQGAVPKTPPPPLPPRVPLLSLRPRWLHGSPRRPARHRWQMRGVSPVKEGHGAGHPGYRHMGGSWGTVPITAAEPAGSKATVPAALAAWAACQPRPAAGLQRDSGDKGSGGDRRPCLRPWGAGGGPARPGSPIAPCPSGLGARGARGPPSPFQPPLIYDLHCRHRAGGDPGLPAPAPRTPTQALTHPGHPQPYGRWVGGQVVVAQPP